MSDNTEPKPKQPGFIWRIIEGAMGNALYAVIIALGVGMLALIVTAIRQIRNGSFFESMLWFCGSFAICYLIIIITLMILAKVKLPLIVQQSSVPAESPVLPPLAGNFTTTRFSKTAILFMSLSVVMIIGVIGAKWRQHIENNQLHIIVPRSQMFPVTGHPNSVWIALWVVVTNGGPDTVPFDWTLQVQMPYGKNESFTGNYADWDQCGIGPRTGWFDNKYNLAVNLTRDHIKHGELKTGTIAFLMAGVPENQIPFGTQFLVAVQDGEGHTIKTTTGWGGPISDQALNP